MAKCEACKREMIGDELGCIMTHLAVRGKLEPIRRLRHKHESFPGLPDDVTSCHDCGCPDGTFHHPGCDTAVCPICGGQESFCDCPIEHYGALQLA